MNHPEYNLQKQLCQYLNLQYKDVLYLSDTVASVKLTMMQATRNKAIQKCGFKCPDLIILQPNKYFNGLMLELKVENPYKKDGNIKSDAHLIGQDESLRQLRKLGYWAGFAWEFNMAKKIIDNYMSDIESQGVKISNFTIKKMQQP